MLPELATSGVIVVASASRRISAPPAAAIAYSLASGQSWRTNTDAPTSHERTLAEPSGPLIVLGRSGTLTSSATPTGLTTT